MKIDGLRIKISIVLTFAVVCMIMAILYSLELIEPNDNTELSTISMILSGYILCDYAKIIRRRYENEDQNED